MKCPKCGENLKMVAANNPDWRDWICLKCAINYGTNGPKKD